MLAKLSVKKPYTVIVGILLVIALGVISFINMTTDLLPSMDLPYVIVYTVDQGATPEAVEKDITRPLEEAFSTLTDIKNVTSTSSENLSLVVMEFASGADMNTAMIEISSEIDQISGKWDDAIGTPVVMKINPDMLPVTISTVSMEGMDLLELSDYVENTLIREYEAIDGVASVSASGLMTQQVDITIEESRVDAINSRILREVDKKLADGEEKLKDAQKQLSLGKSKLASAKKQAYKQLDEAAKAIDSGAQAMPETLAQLNAQREELAAQLEAVQAALAQLDALDDMPEEQRKALEDVDRQIKELEDEKKALEKTVEEGTGETELTRQLDNAKANRAELDALRAQLNKELDDLLALDADALKKTVKALEESISENEATAADVRGKLEDAINERDATRRTINDLKLSIELLEAKEPEPAAEEEEPKEGEAEGSSGPEEATEEEPEKDAEEGETEAEETPSDGSSEPAGDAEKTDDEPAGPAEEAGDEPSDETPEDTGEGGSEPSEETGAREEEPSGGSEEKPAEEPKEKDEEKGGSGSEEGSKEVPKEESKKETKEDSKEEPKEEPKETESKKEEKSSKEESKSDSEAAEALASKRGRSRFGLFGGSALAEGETLEELREQLAAEEAHLSRLEADIESYTARNEELRETLAQQATALDEARAALRDLEDEELDVQTRIEELRARIADLDGQIAAKDAEIEKLTQAAQADPESELRAQIADLDSRITALRESDAYKTYQLIADKKGRAAQRKQLEEAEKQLSDGLNALDENIDKLSRGIIPGGMIEGLDEDMTFEEARGQIAAARKQMDAAFSKASGQIHDAEEKIAKAWREFEDKRDEALEEAGIDGILTVQLVSQILGAQNFDMPAGYVSDADGRYLVSVGTEFKSLTELRQAKLFSLGLDTVDDVRLLDVAKVAISDNSADLFTFVNGDRGIMLSFEKQSTASTAEVAKAVTARSEELMRENEGLQVVEMFNQGDYISLIVDSVLENIEYGGVLAILILLLFLLDWRPTLIVAISIPTSVVVAFVCMYFCGITLNVMSLSGLALGVGMLVDNSIVAIENIYRLRDEEHLPILTACIRGVNQVGGALLASTLTTICVFLPVVFVQGIARDLFSDMGLTIAFSLIASLLVAMTVVPSFAATLFKKAKPKSHRLFNGFQRGYTALLRGALKAKWLVLLIALGLTAWSAYNLLDMPISFMPSVNSTQMSADLSFKDSDLNEDEEKAVALEIMDEIMQVEGVTDISLSSSGTLSMMSSMSGGGGAYSYYILVEEGQRTNREIVNDIRARTEGICDDKTILLDVQESTMDMSAFAGSGISVDISGSEIDVLNEAAQQVAAVCRQVEGAKNINDGFEDAQPKLIITVDKELANDESLTVAQVYQYIAQRLYGAVELTEAKLDGRDYTLYVNADKDIDLEPADIEDMEIEVKGADKTKYVRIGDIATISDGETLAGIKRSNQRRTVSVSFDLEDGAAANKVSDDLEARLKEITLPEGCSYVITGQNEQVMGYMKDLLTMLGIAVLFIFLIMVAQFQSFKSPIIVMFTIPLAFTGGLLALMVTKMDLSIISLVGFLVLSGVVVNNGIVFIDSVNQMRIGGMSKRDALIETGRIRLRPILMTALTTILGMSTMALGKGMGSEMMQPMAVVTIGGLSYATLMTLFVVPVLYDIVNGETMKAREIEMIKESAGLKREGFDDDAPAAPSPAPAADVKEPEVKEETPRPARETPAKAEAPEPVKKEPKQRRQKTEKTAPAPDDDADLTPEEIEALKRRIWEAERRLADRK